jgi:AcrR family transcriptional regulator
MVKTAAAATYHHGDLAVALMDAALARIAAQGTENLSLRALARECGVSATAPYRHFPSKRCLLAAIATRGFYGLEQHCEQALVLAGPQLDARLIALGKAYIEFAVENPTAYQIMFGSVLEDFSDYEQLAAAAESSYALVLNVMEQVKAHRPLRRMTAIELGGVAWAGVHGIASLLLFQLSRDATHSGSPQASLQALQADPDTALAMLMRGLLADD